LPSIDDFGEDVDPTGFYSFDKLMTPYIERYCRRAIGVPDAARR